jgi:hypothetical protein
MNFIQSFSNEFLDNFFKIVTMLGSGYFFLFVVTLILWCINKDLGYRLGFLFITTGAINNVLKETFKVPRPIGHEGIRSSIIPNPGGYSFPSGHAQTTSSFWTRIMLELRRKWIYVVGISIIFLVGLSRIYLGVHWPSDVLAGTVIGIAWVFIANWLFYTFIEGSSSLALLILVWVGMLFVPTVEYLKISGALTGFIIGYWIESKYINYNIKGSLGKQVIKFIIGLIGLLIIKVLVSKSFLGYFLMSIWVTALAPYLFKVIIKSEEALL